MPRYSMDTERWIGTANICFLTYSRYSGKESFVKQNIPPVFWIQMNCQENSCVGMSRHLSTSTCRSQGPVSQAAVQSWGVSSWPSQTLWLAIPPCLKLCTSRALTWMFPKLKTTTCYSKTYVDDNVSWPPVFVREDVLGRILWSLLPTPVHNLTLLTDVTNVSWAPWRYYKILPVFKEFTVW